jgi:hydroxylaminobenzene mutase
MNRGIVRHGFILIALALISGLFIPAVEIPRLAVSAHTIGIFSGVLLIAVGAVWKQFSLSVSHRRVMYGSWLYSSYVNWLGCLVGALLGAGKTTPVASSGAVGSAAAEAVVAFMLISVALVSFVAVGLSIWGLRHREALVA